jgi:integrator complex subunit 2
MSDFPHICLIYLDIQTLFLFQVRITDWIYRQLCHCTAPIHSVIPPLIEAFVSSIITPATRTDCTNEPICEDELLGVFQDPFRSKATGTVDSQTENGSKSSFTTQILLVYYLLLYEDMLLSNMQSISK